MKTKRRILTTLALALMVLTSIAQTSQRGFSFQGYAVSNEGVALGSEAISVRFSVYPKAGSGFVYEETQALTTDAYGVFHAIVGNESPELFQKMDFTAKGNDYWMKVEVKKTSAGVFTTISDAAMLAVPYARHAANGVPVGTIISFAGVKSKIPAGWLVCDGTEYDGASPEYHQLYSMLENTWGGSGTAFNVPDLRGQFLRGADDGAGIDPDATDRTNLAGDEVVGDVVGSYQNKATAMPNAPFATSSGGNHNHATNIGIWSRSFMGEDGSPNTAHQGSSEVNTSYSGSHSHTITGGDNETRPTNAAVIYIIKY